MAALHWGRVKAVPSAELEKAALGSPCQLGHLKRRICALGLPTAGTLLDPAKIHSPSLLTNLAQAEASFTQDSPLWTNRLGHRDITCPLLSQAAGPSAPAISLCFSQADHRQRVENR